MRHALKADHILTALSLIVLLLIATDLAPSASHARQAVNYDCALFYGPLGPDAERDCRLKLTSSRLLPNAID